MKLSDINIRDPFILFENGKYYLYGTRAKNFGKKVNGFDVYVSDDLTEWSSPKECFNAEKFNLNREVCWAPEVHKYNGSFYMFATFTKENDKRGTYVLKSDLPEGPFVLHSRGALTPYDWECLDGTLYTDKNNKPYLVFCHEHTEVIDGTVCYVPLSDDLKAALSKPVYMFSGSSPYWADKKPEGEHYITDGPFIYRTKDGELLLMWSTSIKGKYAQCIAKSDNGEIDGEFVHLEPIITEDGGHGMLFFAGGRLILTYHTPNQTNFERPVLKEVKDNGSSIELV